MRPSFLLLVDGGHAPSLPVPSSYRKLIRRMGATCAGARVEVTREPLSAARLAGVGLLLLPAPTAPFAPEEARAIRSFLMRQGGALWVLACAPAEGGGGEGSAGESSEEDSEGGSGSDVSRASRASEAGGSAGSPHGGGARAASPVSLASLLASLPCGLRLHSRTTVLRACFAPGRGCAHPSQALLEGAPLCAHFGGWVARSHAAAAPGAGGGGEAGGQEGCRGDAAGAARVCLAFPRGCTLGVARPAVALLGTGACGYPFHTPVAAAALVGGAGGACGAAAGRLLLLGSAAALSDAWLGHSHNAAVASGCLAWLALGAEAATGISAPGRPAPGARCLAAILERRPPPRPDAEGGEGGEGGTQGARGEGGDVGSGDGGSGDGDGDAGGDGGSTRRPPPLRGAASHRPLPAPRRCAAAACAPPRPPLAPDVSALAATLRPCLERPEPLPSLGRGGAGLRALLASGRGGASRSGTPAVAAAAAAAAAAAHAPLGVPPGPLRLIPPALEAPLARPALAVYPPPWPRPRPPPLECWDLEEAWRERAGALAEAAAAAARAAPAAEAPAAFAAAAAAPLAAPLAAREGPEAALEAALAAILAWRLTGADARAAGAAQGAACGTVAAHLPPRCACEKAG